MTRLLITGGSGFVGQHLLHHLRDTSPEIELLAPALDITDQPATEALIEATRPDALLHLAAISAIGQAAAEPDHAWAVNVQGHAEFGASGSDACAGMPVSLHLQHRNLWPCLSGASAGDGRHRA